MFKPRATFVLKLGLQALLPDYENAGLIKIGVSLRKSNIYTIWNAASFVIMPDLSHFYVLWSMTLGCGVHSNSFIMQEIRSYQSRAPVIPLIAIHVLSEKRMYKSFKF